MRNKRKKRAARLLMTVGLLLLIAAGALTAYNVWDTHRAEETADSALAQLLPVIPEVEPLPILPAEEILPEYYQEVEIPDYILNPSMEMPVQKVGENSYLGVLEIPGLNLSLPVMSECSIANLKVAPCRYTGSIYTNDMVIAAHNYRGHFGSLPKLSVESEVRFTDADGNVFRYVVVGLETLRATAVEEMTTGDWDLTLFTCTLSGQSRLAIRCESLIET